MVRKAAKLSQPTASKIEGTASAAKQEAIHEDHICPVCQLLLCRPVTTQCSHTLCESCMATWADVSISQQMQIVDVDEEPVPFNAVSGLEARCPMCRTQTTASLNPELAVKLKSHYPNLYAEREAEEGSTFQPDGSIQTVTLYIGNRHRLVDPIRESENKHEWTFFVRPSRPEIVEEVHIHLHPTFRPRTVVCTHRPYEVRRLGWGTFIIVASVVLKAGYNWMSPDAEDSIDGAEKGMLALEWELDFSRFGGKGSMGKLKLKVRNQRAWEADSQEKKEEQRMWERRVRQYERDGRYVPRDEDV